MLPASSPPPPPVRREPIFNLPGTVVWLIGILTAIQILRGWISIEADLGILREFGFVPARLWIWLGGETLAEIATRFVTEGPLQWRDEREAVLRYFVDEGGARPWTLLTYGLLHGSWLHLGMNGLWLAAFGSPVARRLGSRSFLVLLLAGTVAGALTHALVRGADAWPLIGASAAVSAATGAAALFVFARGALSLGLLGTEEGARSVPASSLRGLLGNRPALVFVVFWFASNWLFGSGVAPLSGAEDNIAWEAHVGGFVAGLLLFPLLDPGRRGA